MGTARSHPRVATAAASVLGLALLACATYSDRTEAARHAIQRGDVAGGVKELNKFLKVRKSEELPDASGRRTTSW